MYLIMHETEHLLYYSPHFHTLKLMYPLNLLSTLYTDNVEQCSFPVNQHNKDVSTYSEPFDAIHMANGAQVSEIILHIE